MLLLVSAEAEVPNLRADRAGYGWAYFNHIVFNPTDAFTDGKIHLASNPVHIKIFSRSGWPKKWDIVPIIKSITSIVPIRIIIQQDAIPSIEDVNILITDRADLDLDFYFKGLVRPFEAANLNFKKKYREKFESGCHYFTNSEGGILKTLIIFDLSRPLVNSDDDLSWVLSTCVAGGLAFHLGVRNMESLHPQEILHFLRPPSLMLDAHLAGVLGDLYSGLIRSGMTASETNAVYARMNEY